MSESKSTPGPWTMRDQHDGHAPQAEFPTRITFGRDGYDRGSIIGTVQIWRGDIETAKANARLIAAAPALLAALIELLRVDDDRHGAANSEEANARAKARAAIKLATEK